MKRLPIITTQSCSLSYSGSLHSRWDSSIFKAARNSVMCFAQMPNKMRMLNIFHRSLLFSIMVTESVDLSRVEILRKYFIGQSDFEGKNLFLYESTNDVVAARCLDFHDKISRMGTQAARIWIIWGHGTINIPAFFALKTSVQWKCGSPCC